MAIVKITARIDGVDTNEDRESLASALIVFLKTRCDTESYKIMVSDEFEPKKFVQKISGRLGV